MAASGVSNAAAQHAQHALWMEGCACDLLASDASGEQQHPHKGQQQHLYGCESDWDMCCQVLAWMRLAGVALLWTAPEGGNGLH